jgi:glycerol uptake facilitator-like aquaporin
MCLNPAIAIAMQLFAAIERGNGLLLVYALALVVGPVVGAVGAVYFFRGFYAPLQEGMAMHKLKMSHI